MSNKTNKSNKNEALNGKNKEINDQCKDSSNAGKESEIQKVKQDFSTLVNKVEERIKELEEKETHWAALEVIMEEHASKAAHKITLDIGGQKFAAAKSTLLSHKGSFFDAMLSSGKWKPDSKGRYFIDRNPELFPVILDYLRTGKVNLKRYAYDVAEDLRTELEFYLIDIPDSVINRFASVLLNEMHQAKLKEWLGTSTLTPIYSGSKDGFAASVFHSKCNNKGPTVTVVKSTQGYLFGGYASQAWDSSGSYKRAPGSFLFALTGPHISAPTKFPLTGSNTNNIYCRCDLGPAFGGGDLYISNNCNTQNSSSNWSSYSNAFGYNASTGYNVNYLAESNSFLVSEIEVFLTK